MRNYSKCRRDWENWPNWQTEGTLNYPEPSLARHATDFITVHTFGGRGSPSF